MTISNFSPTKYLQDIIDNNYSTNIKDKDLLKLLNDLNPKIENQKGIYTVLITLCLYKIQNPKQDIRYHKIELENGFSGRSYDTKNITPVFQLLRPTPSRQHFFPAIQQIVRDFGFLFFRGLEMN